MQLVAAKKIQLCPGTKFLSLVPSLSPASGTQCMSPILSLFFRKGQTISHSHLSENDFPGSLVSLGWGIKESRDQPGALSLGCQCCHLQAVDPDWLKLLVFVLFAKSIGATFCQYLHPSSGSQEEVSSNQGPSLASGKVCPGFHVLCDVE